MTELLKNAWLGWRDMTTPGKLAGVWLVALCYLLYHRKKLRQTSLLLYAAVSTAAVILPVTAVLLMLYQTRFYDYEWIWSAVPATAMTAFAATVFVTEDLKERLKESRTGQAAVLLLLLGMLFLAGGAGSSKPTKEPAGLSGAEVSKMLTTIHEKLPDTTVRLWAPSEILTHVREYDGSILLLYGRNMWDAHLNAYSYDTYPDNMQEMYVWMQDPYRWMEGRSLIAEISDEECLQAAREYDVNCILLPKAIRAEALCVFSEDYTIDEDSFVEYFLLTK